MRNNQKNPTQTHSPVGQIGADERIKALERLTEELQKQNEVLLQAKANTESDLKKYVALYESQLFSLINNTSDIIFSLDKKSKIIMFNEPMRIAFKELFGKEVELNMSILDVLPAERLAYYQPLYDQVIRGERAQAITEYTLINGEKASFDESFNPILKLSNEVEVVGISIISRDITLRRRDENMVRLKESQISSLINNTDDLIISVDTSLRVITYNEKFRQWAKSTDRLKVGASIFEVIPIDERPYYHRQYQRVLQGERFSEVIERDIEGLKQYYEDTFNPIWNEKQKIVGFSVVSRNVTERRRTEEQMKTSLREKETLLAEVYHRVKNNLNVVISLLNLQANRTTDPGALSALSECKNRIYSMSLVHEMLYQSDDLSGINVASYISSLASNVKSVYLASATRVSVNIRTDDIRLPLDVAIPVGLILNELITNSFKHAFPDGINGAIHIELLEPAPREFRLTVWDNGVGFGASLSPLDNAKSLGLTIVNTLVVQLRGTIRFVADLDKSTRQTKFEIRFKRPESK